VTERGYKEHGERLQRAWREVGELPKREKKESVKEERRKK